MAPGTRFARFELAVIAAIALVAGIVFLAVEAQSERLAMTLAIRNMRSGLRLAVAERLMRGEDAQIARIAAANPLDFLGPREGGAPDARWQFDAGRGELVYRPRIRAAFGGSDELRWRIDATPAANGRIVGLRLVEVVQTAPGG